MSSDKVQPTPAISDSVGEGAFGFSIRDVSSWKSFVRLLHRPCDPSGLAIMRILFALLMIIALHSERGWSVLDRKFPAAGCHFPLIHSMQIPPIEWLYVIYLVNFIALLGVLLGCWFRLSCAIVASTYWYTFLLDKLFWNNHAYLYGLIAILFLLSDAHRYASIDSLRKPALRNSHVPLWIYSLLRFQIGLVYFLAGLKKLFAKEWLYGLSQEELHKQWMFAPLKAVLTDEQITFFVIHLGGLVLDLFVAFLLFFDSTRKVAFLFGGTFHLINSQMFTIGMFPWTMLATMPLFSRFDWPKRLLQLLPSWKLLPSREPACPNPDCVYADAASNSSSTKSQAKSKLDSPSAKQTLGGMILVFWMTTQLFLPYSHFVTRGYNTWTGGMYGYSWDMMIHKYHSVQAKVTVVEKGTGRRLDELPKAWRLPSHRWMFHPDLIHQYAFCVRDLVRKHHDMKDVEIYLEHWTSLNNRIYQRVLKPDIDVLKARWSPWHQPDWMLPLLYHKNEWRDRYLQINASLPKSATIFIVVDFPGLTATNFFNYFHPVPMLVVYEGKVTVNQNGVKRQVKKGQNVTLDPTEPCNVTVNSATPSIYAYVYVDNEYHSRVKAQALAQIEEMKRKASTQSGDKATPPQIGQAAEEQNPGRIEAVRKKLGFTWFLVQRSFLRTLDAIASLAFGVPFDYNARPIPKSRTAKINPQDAITYTKNGPVLRLPRP